MSIATLKRKTQAQYNNVSVGQPHFSINGTRRSSGYVGQDMLGRSLVRSLSRWGALKGHGGCCGKYPTPQIKTSPEMVGLNNPLVVKSSSLNTHGLIMTKYRWVRRPQPFTSWKPDDSQNINDQSFYIDHVARKAINDNCHVINKHPTPVCCNIDGTNYNSTPLPPNTTKPEYYTGALDASDHTRALDKKCGAFDKFYIRKKTNGAPFGCSSVHT